MGPVTVSSSQSQQLDYRRIAPETFTCRYVCIIILQAGGILFEILLADLY